MVLPFLTKLARQSSVWCVVPHGFMPKTVCLSQTSVTFRYRTTASHSLIYGRASTFASSLQAASASASNCSLFRSPRLMTGYNANDRMRSFIFGRLASPILRCGSSEDFCQPDKNIDATSRHGITTYQSAMDTLLCLEYRS